MLRLTVTLSETEAMEFLGTHWVSQNGQQKTKWNITIFYELIGKSTINGKLGVCEVENHHF